MDDKGAAELRSPAGLLPGEVRGWKPGEPDGFYTFDTLFDLIDGGAEVYRSLNVRAVLSRRYVKAGSPDIIADVFDMGSPSDAFGAFHHDMREGKEAGIGRESEFLGSSLSFWKDRYFVSTVAFDETEEAGRALLDLCRTAAARITADRDGPDLVKLLPPGEIDPRRVHYFHDPLLLGRLYDFGKKNLLGLGARTEGILARCRSRAGAAGARPPEGEGGPPKAIPAAAILLVRYPAREEASKACAAFLREFLPGARPSGTGRTRKGPWAGAAAEGRLLVACLEAPARKDVERLIGLVRNRLARKPGKNAKNRKDREKQGGKDGGDEKNEKNDKERRDPE